MFKLWNPTKKIYIFYILSHFLSITNIVFPYRHVLYHWKFCLCNGEKGPLLTPDCHHKNPLTLNFHSWHCGQIRPLCSKQDTKNERTNLFFYSDSLEILDTLKSKFKFQVFSDCQGWKTNTSICFLGEVMAQQFCFKIYWPLWQLKCCMIWLWCLLLN